jgi:hypothetical protein
MCQPRKISRHMDMSGCSPCECGCDPPFRRYYSSQEEQERLQTYRDQLKKELDGVQERISDMES